MLRRTKISFDKLLALMLLAVAVAAGVAFQRNTPDCGIADLTSIDKIQAGTVILNYAWGGHINDEKGMTASSFGTESDKYGVDAATVIAVVSPTGNIHQTEGSLGQELVIKEVRKGKDIAAVGETSFVYQYFGFCAVDGRIEFLNTLNLMNTDREYLIFMDKSPLSSHTKVPVYILHSEYFGYIRIGSQDTKTLVSDYKSYDFSALKEYEFFSISDSITEVLNSVRRELLERYYEKG
ncbi:MAG: hypothetical protein LBQ15_11590 [Clostridium sp.]|jgi:hypothetical protein|nr:hypothetical protein [Clostridium sp.]